MEGESNTSTPTAYSNSSTPTAFGGVSIRELVMPRALGKEKPRECGCAAELLRRLAALRKTASTQEGDYQLVTNMNLEWARLFMEYIVGSATCSATICAAKSDDMIWYVPFYSATSFYVPSNNQLQVFRRHSRQQPSAADSNYNWEETVCLNFLMQQVYPSPSRRRMDNKGEREEITYPKIYFAIDGFEEIFSDCIVRDGECICVELVARDRDATKEAIVFLGSIKYEVLKQVYDSNASSTWQWAQKLVKPGGRRQEFVRMRGPKGKGFAEMAVARAPNSGYETPLAEQAIHFPEFNAAESQFGRRRMSETNLAGKAPLMNPSRVMMTPSAGTTTSGFASARGRRWQSDTESLNQCPEVEASSIDDELDEGVLTRLWSVRGFGQAWHWLREKKRAECTPLNAYLTYITLPWNTIIQDVMSERQKRPILTFELESLHTPTH